jgi:isopenicillin-N epimerase
VYVGLVLTPADFRTRFMLDPSVIFLNHGSFGAVPRPVFEEQERLRREMEAEPVLFLARTLDDRLDAVRESIAGLVGAASPDDLGLVPNTTTGLNAVARSLDLQPGDEIVVTSHEYGAMRMLWDEVARVAGAGVRVAVLPEPALTEDEIVAAIAAAVTPRTRVIFVSHITSLSAVVLPVMRICAEARRLGIVSIVDGAHAPGQLPLHLDAIGADVYVGNLHKWVCSPRGSAFVCARAKIQVLRGPVVSWGWSWDGDDAFQGRYGWPGTVDPTSFLAVPAALEFRRAHEWEAVVASCRERLERTISALEARIRGVPTAALVLRAPQLAAVFIDLGGREPVDVQRQLWEQFRIEVPLDRVGDRSVVRVSVQAYTTDEDCEALIAALETIL